ncbi:MAG: tetratricopeptide repeat protein, partial [Pseudomonadota bacterium]
MRGITVFREKWSALRGYILAAGITVPVLAGIFLTDAWTRLVDWWLTPAACIEGYLDSRGEPHPHPFRILVAGLVDDPGDAQHRHIMRSLERLYRDRPAAIGFEAVHDGTVACALRPLGGDFDAAMDAAAAGAERLLEETGADVVLWGRVVREDRELTLRLHHPRAAEPQRSDYTLEDSTLTLELDFASDLGALIVAKGVLAAETTSEEDGGFLVPRMREAVRLLQPLTASPPQGLSNRQLGDLYEAHGRAQSQLGLQSGAHQPLLESIALYELAAEAYDTAGERSEWGRTQNNLGNALWALGQRESGTARLEEAVRAYRLALEENTRDRVPLVWAQTQNNLGNALRTLGARESGTARLEEAVRAYRLALE